jgi:predicted MFS family arabinose efflux permease
VDRTAWYVLGVFVVVTTFNTADRYILSILLPDIKREFELSDAMLGFLVGPAFAVCHTLAGLPIARWADRGVRRSIVAGGLFLWSAFTALCGLAQSFWQLLLSRMGVSVCEAAGAAPAQSLLADYFPPERRATAMAVFGTGGIIGMGLGLVVGGYVTDHYGWRQAFFVFGLPGMALAVLLRATVREPVRGLSEGLAAATGGESALGVVRFLIRLPAYRQIVLAASFHAFAGYGAGTWYPTFLVRVYEVSRFEAGTWMMLAGPLMSAIGALAGGRLADGLGTRDVRWYMWLPGAAALLALPFAAGFLLWPEDVALEIGGRRILPALLILAPASMLGGFWSGPTIAMVLGLAKPHMRALAAALLLMTYNLVGLGMGPYCVGLLSDALEPRFGTGAVRYALLVVALAHVAGSLHNALAARTLAADLRAKEE